VRFVGVGTDDMFLIYSAYRRTKASETTAQRLANTFRICGSGITITSLTNVIAFLAGATTNFYGIRLFCFYTSKIKFFLPNQFSFHSQVLR
jgi:predicted RND superfamily exporter protein